MFLGALAFVCCACVFFSYASETVAQLYTAVLFHKPSTFFWLFVGNDVRVNQYDLPFFACISLVGYTSSIVIMRIKYSVKKKTEKNAMWFFPYNKSFTSASQTHVAAYGQSLSLFTVFIANSMTLLHITSPFSLIILQLSFTSNTLQNIGKLHGICVHRSQYANWFRGLLFFFLEP